MARFGLLMLNKGKWGNTAVMTDSLYFNAMVNSSQQLNPSYGYLWWLNGKSSFMVPQLQFSFPGFLFPDAPADCIAALGRDGQMLHIVPSQNLIWIRMGQSPESVPVPYLLANRIWKMIRDLTCATGVVDKGLENVRVYPNPAQSFIQMEGVLSTDVLKVYDIYGNTWPFYGADMRTLNIENFPSGLYILEINRYGLKKHLRFFKI
jgi:CubicO group peptidase (beta-lactamase class C family)